VTTTDCIAALQSGDAGALRRLYAQFSPEVLQWMRHHGGSVEDARDVFQSALVILFEQVRAGELDLSADFGTILMGLCRTIWKKNRADSAPTSAINNDQYEEAWSEHIAVEEKNRLFRQCFRLLGPKCQVILAFFFDGHPLDFICEQVGESNLERIVRRKDTCKDQLIQHIRKDPRYAELA
jgi:RNA polymerase sigma factor (sigma-70 family)